MKDEHDMECSSCGCGCGLRKPISLKEILIAFIVMTLFIAGLAFFLRKDTPPENVSTQPSAPTTMEQGE